MIIIFSLSKAVVCNYLYDFIQGNLMIFELNFKINRVAGERYIGILVLLVTSGMIKTNFEII